MNIKAVCNLLSVLLLILGGFLGVSLFVALAWLGVAVIGGCAGSTSGGVKVVRILTLLKMAVTELKYLIYPRGFFGIFLNKCYLRKNIVYNIAAFIFLYFIVFFAMTLIMATGGFSIMTSITAVIASLGNIGPGFDSVGPSFNYGFLPDYLKWSLSFTMLAGRLEVYTVFVLFTPAFWKK
jgi:trk system potassium uptake protein TrkH